MASFISIAQKVYKVNNTHIYYIEHIDKKITKYGDTQTVSEIHCHVRPYKSEQCKCPICGRKLSGYYDHKSDHEVAWRMQPMAGASVYFLYNPGRIECPEHGILTEKIPWADVKGHFSPGLNNEIAWCALNTTKQAAATLYSINWRTVGNCVEIAHSRIEPDISQRLHSGLRRICVDETSYKKGHKYLTVVYDLDTNQVVWIHVGHGDTIMEKFCLELTPEERLQIEVVAGDGAGWIDRACKKYLTNAVRCVDVFHAVQWANKALDRLRANLALRAKRDYESLRQAYKDEEKKQALLLKEAESARKRLGAIQNGEEPGNEQPELEAFLKSKEVEEALGSASRGDDGTNLIDKHKAALKEMDANHKLLKQSKYALLHNPENRKECENDQIRLIENSYPDLYRALQLKEGLRIIFHMKDVEAATQALEAWIEDARNSGILQMAKLAEKVNDHKDGILNTVREQTTSAKSESTNTTIKSLIKMARGYWNISNLISMIYLKCSNIVIPLSNRIQKSAKYKETEREIANKHRKAKREEKIASLA